VGAYPRHLDRRGLRLLDGRSSDFLQVRLSSWEGVDAAHARHCVLVSQPQPFSQRPPFGKGHHLSYVGCDDTVLRRTTSELAHRLAIDGFAACVGSLREPTRIPTQSRLTQALSEGFSDRYEDFGKAVTHT
jgi:hypothetical protein